MSWITVIWSASAGACAIMGLMHFLVWCRDRRAWANLCFAAMALGVIGITVVEMVAMYADEVAAYGAALRWSIPVYSVGVFGSLGFVHFYFGTGRRSLLRLAIGLRGLVIVVSIVTGLSLHVRSIERLQTIGFLGEPVSILGTWQANPWFVLGQLATLVQIIYLADAALRLWRTGSPDRRRRAAIVGGSLVVFYFTATATAGLVAAGVLRMPFVVSLPFLAALLAMSYESSGEMFRAVSLGRAVRERDVDLSLAVDSAKLGFWLRELPGDEVRASGEFRAMFGFTPTEPLHVAAMMQRLHPEDREGLRRKIDQAIAEGGAYDTEYRVVLPDGRTRWIACRGRCEIGAGIRPVRVRGATLDVTERKRSDDALQESEDRFRTLANHAPVMLWMAGTDKLCTFFNKCWLDFTGRTFEQELGNGWAEGVHPDDGERCLQTYTTAFDARQAFTMQYRLRRHDGEYCWVLDTGVPRCATNGEFLGYVGSAVDVTPLKQAQELAQASEEKFRLVVEGSPIAKVMVDSRGVILLVNAQAEATFGYARAELVGQSIEMLVPDAVRARHVGLRDGFLADASGQGMRPGREVVGRRKDGSSVAVEIGLNPIRSREGIVVVASIVDVTDRLQAAKEAVRQRRELVRMSRVAVLGELTASLAHEISQPLTAIMANAQTAARLYADGRGTIEEFRAIVNDIVADTTRARDVIRQVRGMVKEGGSEMRRVHVVHVVEQVLGFLRSDAVAHGVFVAVEAPESLPPVRGEVVQIQQVLVNLMLNAFDAMESVPRSERRVDVAVVRQADGMLRVSVCDNGSGISPDKLSRVFEPFFTTKADGMGLGLSLSRTIIVDHGGTIGVKNNPDRGACFWFCLPAVE